MSYTFLLQLISHVIKVGLEGAEWNVLDSGMSLKPKTLLDLLGDGDITSALEGTLELKVDSCSEGLDSVYEV